MRFTIDITAGAPDDQGLADELRRIARLVGDGFREGDVNLHAGDQSAYGWWRVEQDKP